MCIIENLGIAENYRKENNYDVVLSPRDNQPQPWAVFPKNLSRCVHTFMYMYMSINYVCVCVSLIDYLWKRGVSSLKRCFDKYLKGGSKPWAPLTVEDGRE